MYFIKNSANVETKVVLTDHVFSITFLDHRYVFGTKSFLIELTGCFIQSIFGSVRMVDFICIDFCFCLYS